MTTITEGQRKIYAWALRKGWWDDGEVLEDVRLKLADEFGEKDAYEIVAPVAALLRRKDIMEKLALVDSEMSEAMEELRDGHAENEVYFRRNGETTTVATHDCRECPPLGDKIAHLIVLGWKPEGFGIELADGMIRLMDIAEHCRIDLDQMIALKMAFNETRAYRHGGKLA